MQTGGSNGIALRRRVIHGFLVIDLCAGRAREQE